ncbi:MAG: divalent metal cation transporter [Candidatus Berkelbacteria bacterium]|nr:divalent metal cation transporter [Candidatus Berkelbacteria bacterium]
MMGLNEIEKEVKEEVEEVDKVVKEVKSTIIGNLYPYIFRRRRNILDYFRLAKNGTITGAADDDPSGIITYSQVGAVTGFALLWLIVLTTPLLIALEDMSSRIGVVTKKSLSSLIKHKYGYKIALSIAIIVAMGNMATIGADIAGMSEVLGIITNAPWLLFAVLITLFFALLLIRGKYSTVSRYLFLLTPVFLAYVATAFLMKPDWHQVFNSTFKPFVGGGIDYWVLAVALLGTTLTPYVVFWQNTEEIEEKKKVEDLNDEGFGVKAGMIYCNLISYFIIITTGALLFKTGVTINTAKDAALALKPLAGEGAFTLFSIGILGSGFLAIPILASVTAYIFSDIFHWKEGLDKKIMQARGFYFVLLLSLIIGFLSVFIGISPIKMLVYSQVLNGLLMPILIYFLIKIASSSEIMGKYKNKLWVNVFGWLALIVNLGFDVMLIWQWVR